MRVKYDDSLSLFDYIGRCVMCSIIYFMLIFVAIPINLVYQSTYATKIDVDDCYFSIRELSTTRFTNLFDYSSDVVLSTTINGKVYKFLDTCQYPSDICSHIYKKFCEQGQIWKFPNGLFGIESRCPEDISVIFPFTFLEYFIFYVFCCVLYYFYTVKK